MPRRRHGSRKAEAAGPDPDTETDSDDDLQPYDLSEGEDEGEQHLPPKWNLPGCPPELDVLPNWGFPASPPGWVGIAHQNVLNPDDVVNKGIVCQLSALAQGGCAVTVQMRWAGH